MRKIIYYVAMSIDGFIMDFHGNMEKFVTGGSGLEQYQNDLKSFDTVIMGRKTYEFGYEYGLEPGRAAYPHMKHYIFSSTLKFESLDEAVEICEIDLAAVKRIRSDPGTDIYLCGGGEFAGWLLENEQIGVLKIKLNPLILGNGIKLFGNSKKEVKTKLISGREYDHGLQIIEYDVIY
ncbi:MAG: dihydrofolate reductase [Pyrinomonadaceae bacterium]|nr:dihydrofolate reductase [Pyrinomonadaceae bacterium]